MVRHNSADQPAHVSSLPTPLLTYELVRFCQDMAQSKGSREYTITVSKPQPGEIIIFRQLNTKAPTNLLS